jgi:PAS domain S-box-containing protein
MKKDKQTSAKIFIDPVNLLIIIIASIFSAEALVTLLLSIASPSSPERYLLLDAGMLVVILFPVIYYLVFKPFTSQIRQLKRSEEALQASEEKYRSIVETTDDSIYLVDGNYRYLFMNKKHLTRMGFSGKEYVGHSFGEFHSEEETKDFIEKSTGYSKKLSPNSIVIIAREIGNVFYGPSVLLRDQTEKW